MEEVEDSSNFWSGPVQSYNSPVGHRFLIGLDRTINGPLPDCDRKYVSVRTMPPGHKPESQKFKKKRTVHLTRFLQRHGEPGTSQYY